MHPKRYDVPLLIICAAALLWFGLNLPLLKVEKMVFWKNEYSVIAGVMSLIHQGEIFLGVVLFFFSFVFPIGKLLLLWGIWIIRLTESQRASLLHWLDLLGKWSMLDVFVVAILIVLVKLGPLANVEPRTGVYFFCSAIFLSMISTVHVERLARRIR